MSGFPRPPPGSAAPPVAGYYGPPVPMPPMGMPRPPMGMPFPPEGVARPPFPHFLPPPHLLGPPAPGMAPPGMAPPVVYPPPTTRVSSTAVTPSSAATPGTPGTPALDNNSLLTSDKLFSTFIKHPPGTSVEQLEEIFRACGSSFHRWRPNVDPSTEIAKNFGFVDYKNIADLQRAFTLLSELQLPDASDAGARKPLTVKADRTTTALMKEYTRVHGINAVEDDRVRAEIRRILGQSSTEKTELTPTTAKDEQGTTAREEDATAWMVSKEREDDAKTVTSDRIARSETSHAMTANRAASLTLDEEEAREQKELERRKADRESLFLERLRNWQSREQRHRKFREENERRDRDLLDRIRLERERMRRFLADYDDEKEDQAGTDEWFSNRQAWVEHRKYLLKREAEQDERDRMREQREKDRERERKERAENGRHPHDGGDRTRSPSRDRKKPAHRSSAETLRWVDVCKQLRDALRGGHLSFLDPLSKENADTSVLYAYKMQWDYLEEKSIEEKVKPLIDQKLETFLGAKEPELVDFILEAILPKKDATKDTVDPQAALEEILVAFGEGDEERREAEDLMRMLWQTMIWEMEKKKVARGCTIVGLDKSVEEVDIAEVL